MIRDTARLNAKAVGLALKPHPDNNRRRKLITMTVVGVWAIITIGIAFGFAVPTDVYDKINWIVIAVVFDQIGQEKATMKEKRNDDGG